MKNVMKESHQALFFIALSILIFVLGCLSFEHGKKWQGIDGIMISLYIIMFVHASRIANNINFKLDEKNNQEKKEKGIMKNKNIKMLINLFLMICSLCILLPLGSKALEKEQILQGVILIMLSFFIIMFLF